MSGDLAYAHEKFCTGVRMLATEPGRVSERLWDAWVSEVHFGARLVKGLEPPFPNELVEEASKLEDRMNRRSKDSMSEDEAREIACEIYDLWARIARALPATQGD